MIVEDFYSTQSRLRQEQAELLSLLKDDSYTWPSKYGDVKDKGGGGCWNHQEMKACKRPSRPPASASCGSLNTSTSEDEEGEDGCEIVHGHHRKWRPSRPSRPPRTPRTPMIKPRASTAATPAKSIYHSGCNPEVPNQNFRARPVPRGILKGDLLLILT